MEECNMTLDLIAAIATILWMNAGSVKIRDGTAGIYSGPLFGAINWIYIAIS
jgi:hypothetical protein